MVVLVRVLAGALNVSGAEDRDIIEHRTRTFLDFAVDFASFNVVKVVLLVAMIAEAH